MYADDGWAWTTTVYFKLSRIYSLVYIIIYAWRKVFELSLDDSHWRRTFALNVELDLHNTDVSAVKIRRRRRKMQLLLKREIWWGWTSRDGLIVAVTPSSPDTMLLFRWASIRSMYCSNRYAIKINTYHYYFILYFIY